MQPNTDSSRRPGYAEVAATLAVFIALGGTAFAVSQVTGRQVEDASLTGRDIRRGTLNAAHVAGYTHKMPLREARKLEGDAVYLGTLDEDGLPAPGSVYLAVRSGELAEGKGRLTTGARCAAEEVLIDGEANHGGLTQPPAIDHVYDQGAIRARGRASRSGHVLAVANCLGQRAEE